MDINKMDTNKIKNVDIKVSDKFIEIYKNINVINQVDEMRSLPKKELYLLLIIILDKFDTDDPVVMNNVLSFEKESMDIYDIQCDLPSQVDELIQLVKETNDKFISIDKIVDIDGNKLPDILTKSEVRDAKLDKIDLK